uniref:60S ribosomal protein L38 n=1 Tax=Steinernema glaseri TaxID=37863 RepID=A0A1I7ZXC3_9BILA
MATISAPADVKSNCAEIRWNRAKISRGSFHNFVVRLRREPTRDKLENKLRKMSPGHDTAYATTPPELVPLTSSYRRVLQVRQH